MTFIVTFFTLGLALVFCMGWGTPVRRRVQVTGHRGASALAPENTLVAIQKAIDLGADYVEIDVQETRDGALVVIHDADLRRTTNATGFIWEKNLLDLIAVDAGRWKSPAFAGEPIPELGAVLDLVQGRVKLNIEIKINGHQQALEARVISRLEQKNFIDQCVVTSFERDSVERVKDLNPALQVGLIFEDLPTGDIWNTRWELLSVHHHLVDRDFVTQAHQHGKEVHVWTVDDPELMRKLIEDGVDNIISNRPDLLRQVVNAQF